MSFWADNWTRSRAADIDPRNWRRRFSQDFTGSKIKSNRFSIIWLNSDERFVVHPLVSAARLFPHIILSSLLDQEVELRYPSLSTISLSLAYTPDPCFSSVKSVFWHQTLSCLNRSISLLVGLKLGKNSSAQQARPIFGDSQQDVHATDKLSSSNILVGHVRRGMC